MMPALSIEHLTFAYGRGGRHGPAPVLHGLSAEIRGGAVTALLGPNAAGKTTLLLLMAGLLAPRTGCVCLNGADGTSKPVHELSLSVRATVVSYVAQRPRVDAPFTVREVVELGRYALGPSDSAVTEAMQAVEIEHCADRLFHELSVGQQQLVSLARALAQQDRGRTGSVFLLDEPMSAMDPRHVRHTASLLRTLAHERGSTVVVVLHDLVLASRLADDVLLLRSDGKPAGCGPVGAMLTPGMLESVYDVSFVMVASPDGFGPSIPLPATGFSRSCD